MPLVWTREMHLAAVHAQDSRERRLIGSKARACGLSKGVGLDATDEEGRRKASCSCCLRLFNAVSVLYVYRDGELRLELVRFLINQHCQATQ